MMLAPTLRNWLLFDPVDFQNTLTTLGVPALLAAPPAQAWTEQSNAHYTTTVSRLGAITNPRPASGGAPAETITQAAGRAVAALQAPSRAITVSDYEALAVQTPGTVCARVRALPGRHPAYPCLAAPGVVTVIVVPAQRRAQPVPSPELLVAVRRYLNRRRLLGTHVEVVGPRYVTVQVTARVKTLVRASLERVRTDVLAALNAFLHPLTGGPAAIAAQHRTRERQLPASTPAAGPPGVTLLAPASPPPAFEPAPAPGVLGWPFGRDVYRSEILQVIDGVAGVDNVLYLELSSNSGPAQCGNLCVGPTELVVSGSHTIEVV
jgi:hypothetical protein